MGDDELVEELAGMLVRIEANYERETSGPGSRFEGQRLEVVQARAILRRIREIAARSVPICSACLTEGCAAGILMCEDARRVAIILRQRSGGAT